MSISNGRSHKGGSYLAHWFALVSLLCVSLFPSNILADTFIAGGAAFYGSPNDVLNIVDMLLWEHCLKWE